MLENDNNWNELYYQSNTCITYDEYKTNKKILSNNSCNQIIISYLINKILIKIYSIWNFNYDVMIQQNNEINKLLNIFDEIYSKYNISNNKPNLLYYQFDKTIFELQNQYKISLCRVEHDNFNGYNDLLNNLNLYLDSIQVITPIKTDKKLVSKKNTKNLEIKEKEKEKEKEKIKSCCIKT
jgi:hypothetical protein